MRRTPLTRRGVLAAAAGLLLAVLAPAAARADSIVYVKDGTVWIANADGSGARQFTLHQYGWSSPSEADDGTVVVAGGLSRINADGSDADAGSELYRFSGDGNQIGGAIPTWGSHSTPACPTYPPRSVRVSPDATKIAYGIWQCAGDPSYTALWTPASATGLSFPNQSLGQLDFYEPAWIDNTHFVVSHAGMPVAETQSRWFVHDVSDGDDVGPGWYEAAMTGTGAQGVISRTGDELAVFEDDAANWLDRVPRTVNLWLYTSPVPGLPVGQGWDTRCVIALDASSMRDPQHLSLSLSPDGTKLLWGDDRGVEIASVADPSNCASISPHLLIPGGSQPFYAQGNMRAAAANPRQPGGIDPPPPPPPPPPGRHCKVPKLRGASLSTAKRLLARAHCALGKVTQPRHDRGRRQPVLVVTSQAPRAGITGRAGMKVRVSLAPKPKPKPKHKAKHRR